MRTPIQGSKVACPVGSGADFLIGWAKPSLIKLPSNHRTVKTGDSGGDDTALVRVRRLSLESGGNRGDRAVNGVEGV